jgi:hypothetical protein
MKLAGVIYYAALKADERGIPPRKTTLQKIIFFSLKGDQRNQLYIPYHYGPFCFSVQSICDSLVANNYLEYINEKNVFKIKKAIDEKIINIDSDIAERCTIVLNYLQENTITETKDIAFLSKIFFFIKNKPASVSDIYKFIKEKGTLYGWFEVVKSPEKTVQSYISHSSKLDNLLGGH